MKRGSVIGSVGCIVLIVGAVLNTPLATGASTTYRNAVDGFSVTRPSAWTAKKKSPVTTFSVSAKKAKALKALGQTYGATVTLLNATAGWSVDDQLALDTGWTAFVSQYVRDVKAVTKVLSVKKKTYAKSGFTATLVTYTKKPKASATKETRIRTVLLSADSAFVYAITETWTVPRGTTPQRPFSAEFKRLVDDLLLITPKASVLGVPCTHDANPTFDAFTDNDKISVVVPPGSINSGEVKGHSYFRFDETLIEDGQVPIYAPADAHLVTGTWYAETPGAAGEYIMFFQASCEVVYILDHITHPVAKVTALMPATPQSSTQSSNFARFPFFRKGELIGYDREYNGGYGGDLGVYNSGVTRQFANQARYDYAWRSVHSDCPYPYFSDAMEAFFMARLATNGGDIVSGAPCRSAARDVAGALAGAWFANSDASAGHAGDKMAIGIDIDGTTVDFQTGDGDRFRITDDNATFADPGLVTTEHCYADDTAGIFFFQLADASTLRYYHDAATFVCPAEFPSSGYATYYR